MNVQRLELANAKTFVTPPLDARVFPPDQVNLTPQEWYTLVVIGGGTAGLVTAAGAAGLGARVVPVERRAFGGDCLTLGCVPSKTQLRAAPAAHDVGEAQRFGVHGRVEQVDGETVMQGVVGGTVGDRGVGDLIGEVTVLVARAVPMGTRAGIIHPCPTRAEAIRKAGGLYNRMRLTPTVKRLFRRWLAWRR